MADGLVIPVELDFKGAVNDLLGFGAAGDKAAGGFAASWGGALAGATGGMTELISLGKQAFDFILGIGDEFHKAFATIRAGSGETGVALQQLEGSFKNVFANSSSGDSAGISKTLTELHSRAGATGPVLEDLTSKLVKLDQLGNTTSVSGFTRALGDWQIPLDKASASLDKLFVISQKTGVPIEEMQGLVVRFGAPMRNFGFSFEESAALLARFQQQGVNTNLVMGSLRIAAGKFAKEGVDLRVGLEGAIVAIKNAGSTSEATALSMKTFGARAGADMADTIRGGKFAIQEFLDVIAKSPETIDRAKSATNSYQGEIQKLENASKVALEPLGTLLVEGLTNAMVTIRSILTPLITFVGDLVSKTIVPVIDTFTSLISDIASTIGGIFTDLAGGGDAVASSFDSIGSFVGELLSSLGDIGGVALKSLFLPFKLSYEVIGFVVKIIVDLATWLSNLGTVGQQSVGGIAGLFEKLKIGVIQITSIVNGLGAAFESVIGHVGGFFSKLGDLDFSGAIGELGAIGTDTADAFNNAFSSTLNEGMAKINIDKGRAALEASMTIRESLDKNGKIEELKQQLLSAKTEAEKNGIASAIAEQMPQAVDAVHTVVDANGEITKTYDINIDKLDTQIAKQKELADESSGDRQLKVVQGLAAQAQQYDANAKKLDELNSKLANQKAAGFDTKETEKNIDEVQSKVKEGAAKLSEDLKNAKVSGLLDNMAPEAQAIFTKIQQRYGETVLKPIEAEAAQSRIGEILGESAKIKTDLDANDKLGDLVERFKNAKDEVSRASIAQEIEKQVPGAIKGVQSITDAQGHTVTAYELNIQKVREFGQANAQALGGDIASKQRDFTAAIASQADGLAAARDRASELAQKISDQSRAGKDTTALRAEFDKLQGSINDGTKKLGDAITQGKKFGLIKGDVAGVGKEFGLTTRQANETSLAVVQIGEATKNASADASDLAASFDEARKAAASALTALKGELVGILAKIRTEGDPEGKLQALYDQKIAEAKKVAQGTIDGDKIIKEVESDIGVTSLADVEKRDKDAQQKREKAAKDAEARRKLQGDQEIRKLKDQQHDKLLAMDEGIAKELAKLQFAADLIRLENRKLDAVETDKTLIAERKNQLQDAEQAIRTFRVDQAHKLGLDLLKQETGLSKSMLDLRKALNAAMLGDDIATIEARGKETLALIEENKQRDLATLISGNALFQEQFEKGVTDKLRAVVDAEIQLGNAKTAADKIVAKQAVDDANAIVKSALSTSEQSFIDRATGMTPEQIAKLRETEPKLAALLADIKLLIVNNAKETADQTAAIESQREAANFRIKIATITDLAEQEKEISLHTIRVKYLADAKAAEGNAAKLTALARQKRLDELKIEDDFHRKTDLLYDTSRTFIEGVYDKLFNHIDEKRQKELNKEIADLQGAVSGAWQDYLDGKIKSYEDYADKITDINKQISDKQDELQGSNLTAWQQMTLGALGGLEAVGAQFTTKLAGHQQLLSDNLGLALDGNQEALGALTKNMVDVGKDTAGSILGIFATMAATGKATLGDFGDAALLQVLNTLQGVVQANIVGIISAAFAISPFLGVGSIIAVGVVEGLLAKAESDIRARLGKHGFWTGGYTGDGGVHEPAGTVHKGEFVHDQVSTKVNRAAYDWLQRNRGRSVEDYIIHRYGSLSSTSVGSDGKLHQSIDALTKQVASLEQIARDQAMIIGQFALRMNDPVKVKGELTAEHSTIAVAVKAHNTKERST